jgi:hypothetical protein
MMMTSLSAPPLACTFEDVRFSIRSLPSYVLMSRNVARCSHWTVVVPA